MLSSMATNNSRAVFDATAATYDRDRMKLIPGHEAFYAAALELIPTDAHAHRRVGRRIPASSLPCCARPSPRRTSRSSTSPRTCSHSRAAALATTRTSPSRSRDYTTEPLPANSDAIVSSLSIHHLEDDRKHALLRPIFTALRPGGLFINADHIAGPTPELEETYQLRWLADVRANGATEQQIADSLFRQQEDRRTPVATQLAWLREAGSPTSTAGTSTPASPS